MKEIFVYSDQKIILTIIVLSCPLYAVDFSSYFIVVFYCCILYIGQVKCSGWSVESFGDTVGSFLLFLPVFPLTLHFCRYSAKLLFRITCNFLTMDVGTYRRQDVSR